MSQVTAAQIKANLDFIDLRNDVRGDHQTIDGIHLNAAGYDQWREAVLSHIRSSLGCTEAGANSNANE